MEHQVTSVVAAALTACTQASRWEMTLALWKFWRGQTPMTPMSNFLESTHKDARLRLSSMTSLLVYVGMCTCVARHSVKL